MGLDPARLDRTLSVGIKRSVGCRPVSQQLGATVEGPGLEELEVEVACAAQDLAGARGA
jgi:hypothetical protein